MNPTKQGLLGLGSREYRWSLWIVQQLWTNRFTPLVDLGSNDRHLYPIITCVGWAVARVQGLFVALLNQEISEQMTGLCSSHGTPRTAVASCLAHRLSDQPRTHGEVPPTMSSHNNSFACVTGCSGVYNRVRECHAVSEVHLSRLMDHKAGQSLPRIAQSLPRQSETDKGRYSAVGIMNPSFQRETENGEVKSQSTGGSCNLFVQKHFVIEVVRPKRNHLHRFLLVRRFVEMCVLCKLTR